MIRNSKILFPHLHQRKDQEGQEFRQSRADGSCPFHVTSAEAGCPECVLHSSDGASVRMAPTSRGWLAWLPSARLLEPLSSLLVQFLASSLSSQGLFLSIWYF